MCRRISRPSLMCRRKVASSAPMGRRFYGLRGSRHRPGTNRGKMPVLAFANRCATSAPTVSDTSRRAIPANSESPTAQTFGKIGAGMPRGRRSRAVPGMVHITERLSGQAPSIPLSLKSTLRSFYPLRGQSSDGISIEPTMCKNGQQRSETYFSHLMALSAHGLVTWGGPASELCWRRPC